VTGRSSVEPFPVFCAKALAGIGELPDTVADRCFPIRLDRQAPGERVERFRRRDVQAETGALRERIRAFVESVHDELEDARPELPEELDDRGQDAAEPLLAIADAAGGDWPSKARRAVIELRSQRQVEDESIGVRLLSDVRDVFERREVDRISTAHLVEALHAIDEAPWGEWHGKPLSRNKLAAFLKQYGIRPRTVRFSEGTARGFMREWFESAFARYLPSETTHRHIGSTERQTADSDTTQEAFVSDREQAEIPLHKRDVSDVSDWYGLEAATEAQERLADRLRADEQGAT